MKVLQINQVCYGSTGTNAKDIAKVLEREGHECWIAYGYGGSDYPHSFRIGSTLENHFHNAFFTRLLGLHGYGSAAGTKRLVRWMEKNRPDIVHLNSLHCNYLNIPILFKYLIRSGIPVVMTLHDCFSFTGKCPHYTALRCDRWKTGCHDCPTFRHTIAPSLLFDRSARLYRERKEYYAQMPNLTVVAVSQWLMHEAEQSILSGAGHRITCIYNWVDAAKFRRASLEQQQAFRTRYGLAAGEKYLLSVSAGWYGPDSKLRDAIALAKKLPRPYRLILVGDKPADLTLPPEIVHIPYIDGPQELSTAYSIAEAYIHLSVEDTFGKVIAEAMACGTVPIAFNSTACGEITGGFGAVVHPHDVDAIVAALPGLETLQSRRDAMVQYVRDHYDKETNISQYIGLYNAAIH